MNMHAYNITMEYEDITDLSNVDYYSTFDMNGDGIKELLVYTKGSEAERMLQIHSFSNWKAVWVGETDAGHSANYVGADQKLYQLRVHMGYVSLYRLEYAAGGLQVIPIVEEKYEEDEDAFIARYQLRKLHTSRDAGHAILSGKELIQVDAGWKEQNGRWWYLNPDATYPTNAWKEIGGKWYYFDGNGYMLTNSWIGGRYYVGGDGAMLTATTTPDGYQVDQNGAWINTAANDPVAPNREYTKDVRTLPGDEVQVGVVVYPDAGIYIDADSTVEDKGNYFAVHNAVVSVGPHGSDPDIMRRVLYEGTLFIRKNAIITTESGTLTAEEMYKRYKAFSTMGVVLRTFTADFDAEGYLVGFVGGGFS